MRFSLMSYEMPEVSGPKYGCFAKIPRHPPEIKKGLFKSTYMDDFLSRFDKVKYKPITCDILTSTGVNSGLRSDFEPVDKKHISSKLVNERYNKDPDSKYNTEIQRSWTYHRDPAIIAVEDLKMIMLQESHGQKKSNLCLYPCIMKRNIKKCSITPMLIVDINYQISLKRN